MKKKRNIFSIIIVLLILVIQYFEIIDSFEYDVEDALYQQGCKNNYNVYVVGIDEVTLSEYGDFSNFSRDKMADLINKLMEDPKTSPAVIALDIAYFSRKNDEVDDKLIEAVKNAGNVVLVDTVTFGNDVNEGTKAIMVEDPFDELYDAAYGVGHSNYQLDSDGVVRHRIDDIKYNGRTIKSFAETIFEAYLDITNQTSVDNKALDSDYSYIIYAGKPRTFYGSVGAACSFSRVLSGDYHTSSFKDAIVLVGAYATGMQDNYYTSIDKQTQMYGVEIHANMVNQFINKDYRRELTPLASLIPTVILVAIAIVILNLIPSKFAVAINAVLVALYVGGCYLFSSSLKTLLPILCPAIAVLLVSIVSIIIEYVTYSKDKKAIIEKYAKFVPRSVAEKIANEGEESLKLGGERKNIAVLFVDIRGFTTLSESLTPEEVVNFLNQYYIITTEAVFNNGGTVDKFVGDETMAIFNAPLDLDNYIEKAVDAGLEMVNSHDRFNDMLPEELRDRVWYGVGVHFGDAVVGVLGTTERMDYTAIGDTVNTGARLQGQAKANELIISKDVYNIIKDNYICEPAGSVKLKGKANEMELYKVIARGERNEK